MRSHHTRGQDDNRRTRCYSYANINIVDDIMKTHAEIFENFKYLISKVDTRLADSARQVENLRALIGLDTVMSSRDRQELGLRLSSLAMQVRQSSARGSKSSAGKQTDADE